MKVFVVGSGNYESLCCEILCFRYTATVVHGWAVPFSGSLRKRKFDKEKEV